MTPEAALNDNERFAQVWGVLRALRSHDDRLDADINKIDLNKGRPERIILGGDRPSNGDEPTSFPLPFPPLDLPAGVIFAKIVEKCGDRKYWETWAKDVADIFARLVARVECLAHDGAGSRCAPGAEKVCGDGNYSPILSTARPARAI